MCIYIRLEAPPRLLTTTDANSCNHASIMHQNYSGTRSGSPVSDIPAPPGPRFLISRHLRVPGF